MADQLEGSENAVALTLEVTEFRLNDANMTTRNNPTIEPKVKQS